MSIAILGVIGFLFVVAAITFFVVRRAMRLAVRLAFVGALLFALLVGAFAAWYKFGNPISSSPSQTERRPATTTPRRASNSTR